MENQLLEILHSFNSKEYLIGLLKHDELMEFEIKKEIKKSLPYTRNIGLFLFLLLSILF